MAGLEATFAARLAQRAASQRMRQLTTPPPADVVDFSSNDYLSLSSDRGLQRAFVRRFEALIGGDDDYDDGNGPRPPNRRLLGSGGSRLLDGNPALAEALEGRIARFHAAPAALLFTSAYDANVGLLSCAPQPGDVVLYDEAVHASTHDGLRLGRAGARRPFAHASVVVSSSSSSSSHDPGKYGNRNGGEEGGEEEETTSSSSSTLPGLAEALAQTRAGDAAVRDGTRHVFVCVEAVYSMDGRALNLPKVVATVEAALPRGNGHIVLDEVHATGVLGPRGRGLACQVGLEDRVWARVLGFGKAMGCAGGAVLCSATTRSYLINYARSLIYTTAPPVPTLVALDLMYEHVGSGAAEGARARLRDLATYAHAALAAARARACAGGRGDHRAAAAVAERGLLRLLPPPPSTTTTTTMTPILPVYTTRARALAAFCRRRHLLVRAVVAPTVPAGAERVRVCLHAANTRAQVDALAAAVEAWLRGQVEADRAGAGPGDAGDDDMPRLEKGARL